MLKQPLLKPAKELTVLFVGALAGSGLGTWMSETYKSGDNLEDSKGLIGESDMNDSSFQQELDQ